MIDHYRTLGVASTADESVIRAVYVELMKRFHPDRSASPETLKRAQAINEAYAVLSDPKRRAAYDDEREGLQPWERGAALPVQRRSQGYSGYVMLAAAVAALGGAVAIGPGLSVGDRQARPAAALSATKARCPALADPERVRAALIMRLDEIGALDRTAAAALTAAKLDVAAPSDARDLASPGRHACLATLAITLPPDFSTAGGQGTVLSELQFSVSRTEPDQPMEVQPEGRLVAALSGIRHQPPPEPVGNPMIEEEVPLVEEPLPPAPRQPMLPIRPAEAKREVAAPPRKVPETRAAPAAPVVRRTDARAEGLAGLDRQTMNFYGQSLRHASAAKKGRLEQSHGAFSARLAACGSDACRRSTYLARNVEISRIMMGD